MKSALALLVAAFGLLTPLSSQAQISQVPDCKIHPSKLGEKATLILKDFAEREARLPSRLVIGNRVEYATGADGKAGGTAIHEAFYRPLDSELFMLVSFPVFGVQVDRNRHIFYVCGRADTKNNLRELTIYLMKGYNMEPTSVRTFLGDVMYGNTIQVAPTTVTATPLAMLDQTIFKTLEKIPLIGQLLQIPQIPYIIARYATETLVSDFGGLGVERIVLTEKYVELSSGVDLENPQRARFVRRIDINKAKNRKEGTKVEDIVYDPNQPSQR